MSSTRLRSAYLSLVCLLLLAQHTAVTHGVWHGASPETPSRAAPDHFRSGGEAHGDGGPADLCVYHAALGTVFGADAALPVLSLVEERIGRLALRPCAAPIVVHPVPAQSRGPPLPPLRA